MSSYRLVDTETGMIIRHYIRTLREAILLPEQVQPIEHVRLWETACRNRGIHARIFLGRDEALAWLQG